MFYINSNIIFLSYIYILHSFVIFNLGKLKPTTAFMTGKLKISGNLQKAMKLEKLMISLKAKL